MTDYIHEYYKQIQRKQVVVGKWIRKIFEIIIDGLNEGFWFYNEKKAQRAIAFIESFVHHSKGRNDLLKLELWQKAIVCCIFGVIPRGIYRCRQKERQDAFCGGDRGIHGVL